MSGIGNYVHYTAGGYFHRGINKNGSDSPPDVYKILNDQRTVNRNRAKRFLEIDRFVQKYQETLDNLLGGGDFKDSGITTKDMQEIQKAIQQYITSSYGNKVIDWARLGIDRTISDIDVEASKIRIRSSNVMKQTVISRIEALEKTCEMNRQQLKDRTGLSEAELEQVFNEVKLLRQDYNEIDKMEQGLLSSNKMFAYQTGTHSATYRVNGKLQKETIIERINGLIQRLKVDNIAMASGDALELSGAVAGLVAQGVSAKEIIEMLKKVSTSKGSLNGMWTGKDRANPVIMGTNFDTEFVKLSNIKSARWNFGSGNLTFSMPTQNKIDFYISPDGVSLRGVSAKNINMGKSAHDIQIVGGTDLLSLIQNEDSNFVNHYLNITSRHYAGRRENATERTSMDLEAYRHQAHLLMKEIIFINSLTAENISKMDNGKLVSSVPDYFLLNDSSKVGGIRVISMNTIISKVLEDIQRYCSISGYNNPLWDNTWDESSAQGRITKIIQQLHSTKLYVRIKGNTFNSI